MPKWFMLLFVLTHVRQGNSIPFALRGVLRPRRMRAPRNSADYSITKTHRCQRARAPRNPGCIMHKMSTRESMTRARPLAVE